MSVALVNIIWRLVSAGPMEFSIILLLMARLDLKSKLLATVKSDLNNQVKLKMPIAATVEWR